MTQMVDNQLIKYDIVLTYQEFVEATKDHTKERVDRNQEVVTSDWLPVFLARIRERESKHVELLPSKARINPIAKKSNTSYFNGYAKCKSCHCNYIINIKHKPIKEVHVVAKVSKSCHHDFKIDHSKHQIRGEEREELARRALIECNGSAIAIHDKIVAENDLSNQCNQHIPSLDVIRRTIHELMTNEFSSTCWITNVLCCADSFVATFPAKKLKGFVQNFTVNFLGIFFILKFAFFFQFLF
jgi:hypothetical protein